MANSRVFPGSWLVAAIDHSDEIKKGDKVQILYITKTYFSVPKLIFVGKVLEYPLDGWY